MSQWVVVARYSYPHEAQIAKASLLSANIPCALNDEHTINMQWLYSDAVGGIRLMVKESDAEQAWQILQQDYSTDVEELFPEQTIMTCPNCGSENIRAFTKGKRSAFLVFLLAGFPLFFYQHGFKCDSCKAFWQENTEQ
ncbi:DUF2007 domain-containing protein [Agarivorans sp. Alg241-V36]|uniref:putative signal transducing protein n=1 Tax=Agarivorans sp. Alg241-V36 TaxID=2305992 RepID=UPI0013D229A9|nr:DUF2007 domain-containing protein [Agarivorans sp. Alg241-V36]